jgi:membrane protein
MTIGNDKAGAGARSPFAIPTEGWLAVLRRTWEETGKDNIGLIAAGIAFYAFAAIVPLLGAVVLNYGLFAEPETVRSNVEHVFAAVPREAATIITEQLVTVVETSKGKQGLGLIIAIALAFYGATKGASAIVTALNVAYGETERRGFFRVNLLYFALVAGGVFLIFLAIASTTLLGFLESLVPRASDVLLTLIRVAGYALLGAFVVTAAAILYRFGPDRRKPSWVWLSPGSLAATMLWLGGTAGFGVYVSNFGNYGATYGSLSAVIVMLTWLWLSAFVFLLGAELNAELERQVEGEGRRRSHPPLLSAIRRTGERQTRQVTIDGRGRPTRSGHALPDQRPGLGRGCVVCRGAAPAAQRQARQGGGGHRRRSRRL